MTDETIFVVVLSYNGLADTRKCLTSLHPALRPGVRPVLVDNGSTDGTAEAVAREFPWCEVLRVEVNHGPVGGNNAGIKAALEAGAKWIMLLNNDTTVDPRLFDRMQAAAAANPGFAVLGPDHHVHGRSRRGDDGRVPVQPAVTRVGFSHGSPWRSSRQRASARAQTWTSSTAAA